MSVFEVPADGPVIDNALDVIGDAFGTGAETVVIPVERLDPAFFDLRTGIAGEMFQKFVNYRLRLVILGDVGAHVAASNAFRDLVRESNRGRHVWFVANRAELAARGT
ncbi:hypothetical protein Val02_39660 [Virgisporangium aliadipatigenens]|uniref:DUF4180 domain-containing protein n=1 Tax=Virgisporangium aliadipatigenens TaxID=741659 RepID=A0A8J4DQJ0_9ACTN|nr:DUF4180 domain-containing protein [Virgisporangium aliadipatigenens]GIJ47080.1 hypothetical protein Val02_39660 [Virgisporangium aliadipatigenens]